MANRQHCCFQLTQVGSKLIENNYLNVTFLTYPAKAVGYTIHSKHHFERSFAPASAGAFFDSRKRRNKK